MSNIKSDSKQMIQQCYHCGNKGLMNIVGVHKKEFGEIEEDEYGNCYSSELHEWFAWYMLSCPVCDMTTFLRDYSNECPGSEEEEILYPRSRTDYSGVPEHIKSAFESATKVKGIDTAICLLSLRRTLEAICKDKNAKGRDLEKKIEDLVNKKILPDTLNDACWIIRQLGNDAAHADNKTFYIYQVNQVIDFVAVIIDYLYVMPLKISRLKETIESEKNGKKNCNEIIISY